MCSSSSQASVYFGCSVVKMMHISEGEENRKLVKCVECAWETAVCFCWLAKLVRYRLHGLGPTGPSHGSLKDIMWDLVSVSEPQSSDLYACMQKHAGRGLGSVFVFISNVFHDTYYVPAYTRVKNSKVWHFYSFIHVFIVRCFNKCIFCVCVQGKKHCASFLWKTSSVLRNWKKVPLTAKTWVAESYLCILVYVCSCSSAGSMVLTMQDWISS